MGRLSPLVPLAVLMIAIYGVVVSFHGLVHQNRLRTFRFLDIFGNEQPEELVFRWDTAPTSNKLNWQPCHPEAVAKMECTRLAVPLNYSNPDGEQASIALARIPSPLQNSPGYRGPILLNPGGPGGSGVDLALRVGAGISLVVGPQFDIVGFDPRGTPCFFIRCSVGRSLPSASLFDAHLERMLWEASGGSDVYALHVLNATADDLARTWARSNVVGQLAAKRADVLRHFHTDHTARDMLSIVKAHGQEKLQYWGFSYGSVLGSTFAAMFPDKVGRLVIDGVVDMEDYYETLWSTNLVDTHKTMDSFYSYCHAAGSSSCAFWAPSPEQIKENLYKLYDAVRERPIPVTIFDGDGPVDYGLIDYNLLRMSVFAALYTPWAMFPLLAEALADLQEAINSINSSAEAKTLDANQAGQKLFKIFHRAPMKCGDACGCSSDPKKEKSYPFLPDAELAIACNDGSHVPNTLANFEAYFEDLNKVSEWGEVWAGIRAGCIGWPNLPKTNFRGPIRGNTSHPLLIVGNTADPVTPLWAAKKTSKSFPGSVVLTQDSPGHCSLSAPSYCTQLHIRNYFVTGELPKPGTVCSVLGSPFTVTGLHHEDAAVSKDGSQSVLGKKGEKVETMEEDLVDAVWKLSQEFSTGLPLSF